MSTTGEKIFAWGQLLIGQVPGAINYFGKEGISIYQPGIYEGREWLLICPLFVGCIATWSVATYKKKAMWGIVPLFFLVVAVVTFVWFSFPAISAVHSLNWALSYCAVALFCAAVYGLIATP
ncbi:hypothetical protein FHS26_004364 [Rhizobium pisi]|uniref:Uncharacterized protein n=1 Tax=Rhizobium pisi TaxID=574561 RepID=A0A7W5G167_9HYPH|nr:MULTISPECIES: hypothetical protein [Rhizobium]MBB3136607.1 hypothetical protein [Rhizobium pisi]MBY5494460.1 hypothetical protein [Rhizobium leguminosarum]TCA37977.1 hypothetical protein E0H72_26650 [Rhizobium leguminosarum bv. viciae]TCA48153.1 hypothetical protein E0H71_30375 [Rhizobium leguminosarum bv. viciae]